MSWDLGIARRSDLCGQVREISPSILLEYTQYIQNFANQGFYDHFIFVLTE